jgi:glycosyltransferase involved in cell wall biosynthesis
VGGGIGTFCEEYLRAAKHSELDITVFVSEWGLSEATVESEAFGYKVVRFNPASHCEQPGLFGVTQLAYGFFRVVQSYIKAFGAPDVMEAQDYQAITYFILQDRYLNQSEFKDIPVCLTIHSPGYISRQYNDEPTYMLPSYWKDEMERFCIGAADARWSTSQLLIDRLMQEFPGKDFELIRNPMTLTESNHAHPTDGGIYFYGRVQVLKGIKPLLDTYAALVREGIDEPLYLIGGDTHYTASNMSFFDMIRKRYGHLIDRGLLHIVGQLPREEAMKRLAAARTVVIPSFFENYAYAALEMFNLRRVVVTSKTCGHSEILKHGESALIFDHNAEDDLKVKLRAALELTQAEREAMSYKVKDCLREASEPERYMSRKIGLIKKAIQTHRSIASAYPFIRQEERIPSNGKYAHLPHEPGLLSIVIPFFNLGDLLEEAIQSAIDANYQNKEIIVLNASSTGVKHISQFYLLKEKYRNVDCLRFEHVRDMGLADTRNQGALLSRGEFLTFHDPDDLVHPDYYSRAMSVLNRYENVSAVGCWVKYFEMDTGQFISWNPEPPFFLFHNMLNTASSVFRRKDFLEFGQNDLNMHMGMEDYEAMISLVESGRGCVVIPELLFYYRIRANSMMRQLTRKNDIYAYEYMAKKHARLFEKYAVELTGLLNGNGSGFLHDNPQIAGPFGA